MISLHRTVATVLLVLALAPMAASAQTGAPELPKEKQTKLGKYMSAAEAAAAVKAEGATVVFIDVRTRGELQFVGVPQGIDAHVPYVDINEFGEWDDKAGRYKLDINSNFGRDVGAVVTRKGLGKDGRVILICRSGDRSSRAVNTLADLGYTNVISVHDGFEGDLSKEGRRTVNGWKNAGLPWGYKLEKTQAYLPPR